MLKGVILSAAPHVQVVDVTHEVEPHDVRQAAFLVWQCWSWFPEGTVHLVVVDPGVGTERRILAGRYSGRYVVAPDNGILTFVHRLLEAEGLRVVEQPVCAHPEVSATFHGRDILAPVAARLAVGERLEAVGRPAGGPVLLAVEERARETSLGLEGAALSVDRFGTLVTNVWQQQLAGARKAEGGAIVFVDGEVVGPIRSTFGDVPVGEAVAYVGSGGLLEVAVHRGRACERFGRSPVVEVRWG